MRNAFIGYHPPSSDELDRIWSSALIVVDTNVLLNLYRLSPQAREKLLSVMEAYSDRIWMPHQVGVEFHDNRIGEIRNQQAMGSKLLQALNGFQGAFAKVLDGYSLNVDVKFLQEDFIQVISEFSEKVKEVSGEHLLQYGVTPQRDPILAALEVIFDGRVGSSWDAQRLERLYVEAEERYSKKIPPGFQDAKDKQAPRKYGDYILWAQILGKAEAEQTDVLFVTDDKKSDWWWESQGQILGPEPRLRDEFKAVSGRLFYAYRSSQFIRESDGRRAVPVDEQIVKEIQTTSDAYAERERVAMNLARELGATEQALVAARDRAASATEQHIISLDYVNRSEAKLLSLTNDAMRLRQRYNELRSEKTEPPTHEYVERLAEIEADLRTIEVERVAAHNDVTHARETLRRAETSYQQALNEAEYLRAAFHAKEAMLQSLEVRTNKNGGDLRDHA